MRILAILLFPCMLPLAAAAEEETPLSHTIENYLDGRDVMAPATGGLLGVFHVQLHLWAPKLTGDLTVESGDTLDAKDDLGIDDYELTLMPQFQVMFLGLGLRFDGYFLDYSGNSLLSRSFTFGGQTFLINEQIQTDLSIQQIRLMLVIPVIDIANVALSVQVGAAGLFLEGTVVGATTGRASRSEDIAVPLVGVVLQAKFFSLLFEADVLGMTIDYDDVSGTIIDLRVSIGTTILEVVAIHVGYRHVLVEGEAAGFLLDITLTGFFIGVSVQF